MDIFITLVLTILIFGVLVFVHEFGHFIVAIKSGVHVDEFAFGFGPKVLSRKWKGVTYRINAIPLGGYVKMMGDMDGSSFRRYSSKDTDKKDRKFVMDLLAEQGLDKPNSDYSKVLEFVKLQKSKLPDEDYLKLENYMVSEFIPNHPKNFDNKGFLPRFAILIAGVVMNFVLGSLLFYVMFFLTDFTIDMTKVGDPKFIGAEVSSPPVIFNVYKEEYKDLEGSLLLSISGEKLLDNDDFERLLSQNYNQRVNVEIQNSEGTSEREIILTGDGLYTNFDEEVRDKVLLVNISEDSSAQKAGLVAGDILLTFDGIDLKDSDHLRDLLDEYRGEEVTVQYINLDGEYKFTNLDLPNPENDKPILGAIPVNNSAYYEDAIRLDYSDNKLFSGVLHATNLVTYNITAMSSFIGEAVQEKSIQPVFSKVNSIVAIVDITHYFVKVDSFINILNMVAMLSVILAFMNILPIPLFDGGHLLFLIIEKIRGKKISMEMQNKIGQVVFVLLILLTIAIVLKDVLQFEWPKRIVGTVSGIIK
jgi:regulator of sigma E protease